MRRGAWWRRMIIGEITQEADIMLLAFRQLTTWKRPSSRRCLRTSGVYRHCEWSERHDRSCCRRDVCATARPVVLGFVACVLEIAAVLCRFGGTVRSVSQGSPGLRTKEGRMPIRPPVGDERERDFERLQNTPAK